MVVDLPRRWRWAIGSACGGMLALGLWFVGSTRIEEGGAARAAPAATAPVSGEASPVAAAAPDPAVPAASAGERHADDEFQVCGGAWVRMQADGSVDGAEFERAMQLAQQRERVLAALRSSRSDLARAAALVLAATGTSSPATALAGAVDGLARAALASTDPRVYALAFKACGASGEGGGGACRMLSAGQWARLDPENAAPWQFILAAAAARGDRAAQDDALFHLAHARRSASGAFDVAGAVLDAIPDDEAATLATLTMLAEVLGVQAAGGLPGTQLLYRACRGDALRDPNRAQTCASLAEVMTERSDSLLERTIGIAIGEHLGWPAERVDRLRGEYIAYTASMVQAGVPASQDKGLGCARIRRELELLRRNAALGEVGAMREWVIASGKPPAHFIDAARARRQQVEAAASAASAASGAVR